MPENNSPTVVEGWTLSECIHELGGKLHLKGMSAFDVNNTMQRKCLNYDEIVEKFNSYKNIQIKLYMYVEVSLTVHLSIVHLSTIYQANGCMSLCRFTNLIICIVHIGLY